MSRKTLAVTLALCAARLAFQPAAAAGAACDRACLAALADRLVASMVHHAPGEVPLAPTFRATVDNVAGGLPMLTPWRTTSGSTHKWYAIDTASQQLFVAVTLQEGATDTLLWGRLKVEDGSRFSELELFQTRSRADAGFIFDASGMGRLPNPWHEKVAAGRLPSREQLARIGRAMFDNSIDLPPSGPACFLLENGGVVKEEPEWQKYFGGGADAPPPPGAGAPGGVPPAGAPGAGSEPPGGMGCPLFPGRPADPHARVDVVDSEQGVVVAIATVRGLVEPYPVTKPTWSAFVPYDILSMFTDSLKKANATGLYKEPVLQATPASISVGQAFRVYDGKVQGFHMFEKLGPPNATSPWVAAEAVREH